MTSQTLIATSQRPGGLSIVLSDCNLQTNRKVAPPRSLHPRGSLVHFSHHLIWGKVTFHCPEHCVVHHTQASSSGDPMRIFTSHSLTIYIHSYLLTSTHIPLTSKKGPAIPHTQYATLALRIIPRHPGIKREREACFCACVSCFCLFVCLLPDTVRKGVRSSELELAELG